MALLPDAALVVLLFHEPGDQQVKQLQEQAPDLQLIPKPLFFISPVHPYDQLHQVQVILLFLFGEQRIVPVLKISCKTGNRYLHHDGEIGVRDLNGMYLIGIDNHKISGLQQKPLIVDEKFNLPVQHQENLNRTVPVLSHPVIAVPALKQEQPERQILIGHYQFVLIIHIHPPSCT